MSSDLSTPLSASNPARYPYANTMGNDDKPNKGADEDDEEVLLPLHNDRGKRKCTDVLCLILFIVAMGAMFGVSIFAWSEGEHEKITNGMDYRGCICGLECDEAGNKQLGDLAVEGKIGGSLETLCADKCPGESPICYSKTNPEVLLSKPSPGECVQDEDGDEVKFTTVPSRKIFTRCIPQEDSSDFGGGDSKSWTEALNSVENGAEVIVASAVVAVIVAFLYLVFLQACAKVFTYIGMGLVLIALLASGAFMFQSSEDFKEKYGDNEDYKSDPNYQMRLGGSIIAFILAFLYICFLLFMCKRINLAIKVIQMASRAVRSAPFLPVVPTLLFLLTLGIAAVWAVSSVLLFSIADVNSTTVNGVTVRTLEVNDNIRYAFLYMLFGFFWVTMFIVALVEMTTAFVVTSWYFAPRENGERKTADNPVRKAFWYSLRYHFGSLAFGSLLIAIIKTMRAVLEYVEQRIKKSGQETKFVKCAFCCCRCCLWCLEKCMRFINKIAYTIIVLTSKPFLTSAFKAGKMIFNNFARVGALAIVSAGFLLLGKIVVAAVSTLVGYAILTKADRYADETKDTAVANPLLVAVIIFLVSWTVGSLFMNILDSAMDSMLVAYIYNEKMGIIDDAESKELQDVNEEAKQAGYGEKDTQQTNNAYKQKEGQVAGASGTNEANYGE
eukprot:gb/GECG01014108.1/.p1 GENE.gb/GECG01014108.1/~~gb/GECG01014108.1/.p1  ORF type:complete len:669 (+),score=74.90 gb/GECG01014108.1/:1-2007(+)